jgi:hypothetical protein
VSKRTLWWVLLAAATTIALALFPPVHVASQGGTNTQVLQDNDHVTVGGFPVAPLLIPEENIQPTGARALGKERAAARGWVGEEWVCLDNLFTKESEWEPGRINPVSGATGIPQALPGTRIYPDLATMERVVRTVGGRQKHYLKNPNALAEIEWGLDYIVARPDYNSPCDAWRLFNERSPHWY